MADDDSASTVLVAGSANLLIAIAKLVAGIVSGSSAMLAEGAHSVGDTMNQVFLMASLRRSQKPADEVHPFGYGMERYVCSLLAAVGIFVLGAGFAAYEGLTALLAGGRQGPATWSFVVLGVSALFEGSSFAKAIVQLRGDAAKAEVSMRDHLRREADPALRAVVWEDGVALVGLALAAGGLLLDELTGGRTFDGIASIAIALLLVGVAYGLGRQNQQYLIGKAAPEGLRAAISEEILGSEGVDAIMELLTMRLSPDQVLVAARVDLADHLTPEQIEQAADEIDTRVRERFPEVRHIFLDPTPDRAETGPH